MPPKRKKSKKKGKKKEKRASYAPCEVDRCSDESLCLMGFPSEEHIREYFYVCRHHHFRFYDKDDDFDLYEEFNLIPNGPIDRFGFPIARDEHLYKELLAKRTKSDHSSSIGRLKAWKEKNKDKKRVRKRKPTGVKARPQRQTLANVKTKKNSKDELDDVLAGILG